MFLHLSVILFTGGDLPHTPLPGQTPPADLSVILFTGGGLPHTPLPGQTPSADLSVILFTGGGVCNNPRADTPPWADPPPLRSACRDTGNKWAVRILLECNLVVYAFTLVKTLITSKKMQKKLLVVSA